MPALYLSEGTPLQRSLEISSTASSSELRLLNLLPHKYCAAAECMLLSLLALTCSLWLDLRGVSTSTRPRAISQLRVGVLNGLSDVEVKPEDVVNGFVCDRGTYAETYLPIPMLEVEADVGAFAGRYVGSAPSTSQTQQEQVATVYQSIRMREDVLVLLGSADAPPVKLFRFALAQAQHCRSISGCTTRLLCECHSTKEVDEVCLAADADELAVPIGIIMPPDPDLWCHALKLRM